MYLLRQDQGRQVSPYGQAAQQSELLEPDTGRVVSAFVQEATEGIGTLSADLAAQRVKSGERLGTPLSKEEYELSPNYRKSIPYYRGITEDAARELSIYSDESDKRAEFISDATSGQYALGLAAGFTAGVLEPKNIATGVAGAVVLSPLAAAAPAASNLRRLMKLRQQAGQYSAKIGAGAMEGLVSAAIAEPSNQYSASILRQDYTMADSAWNIATSTVFGVAASTAGIVAPKLPKYISDKWQTHGARTPDLMAAELDIASNQLTVGKRVDVSVAERSAMGEVSTKSLPEKYAIVDRFLGEDQSARLSVIKDLETKVASFEDGVSLSLYKQEPLPTQPQNLNEALGGAKRVAETYKQSAEQFGDSPEVYLEALDNLQQSTVVQNSIGDVKSLKKINKAFNEARVAIQSTTPAKVRRSPAEVDSIARQIDDGNKSSIQRSLVNEADPENDTALDVAAWRELDDYDTVLLTESEKASVDDYNEHLKAIAAMKKEGLLNDNEMAQFTEALNGVSEKDINAGYQAALTCLTRG